MIVKALWSRAMINDLPDSAFLYVAEGGTLDDTGRTTPRDLRKFPVRDPSGALDIPHLRNALARIPSSTLDDDAKALLTATARGFLDSETHEIKNGVVFYAMAPTILEAARGKLGVGIVGHAVEKICAQLGCAVDKSEVRTVSKEILAKGQKPSHDETIEAKMGSRYACATHRAVIAFGSDVGKMLSVPHVPHPISWLSSTKADKTLALVEKSVCQIKPTIKDARAYRDPGLVAKLQPGQQYQRLVFGVVLSPGEVDLQGDILDAATIEKAAHEYLEKYRVVGDQHVDEADAVLVETWILRDRDLPFAPVGSWLAGFRVDDEELFGRVLSGDVGGFSIGGHGRRIDA